VRPSRPVRPGRSGVVALPPSRRPPLRSGTPPGGPPGGSAHQASRDTESASATTRNADGCCVRRRRRTRSRDHRAPIRCGQRDEVHRREVVNGAARSAAPPPSPPAARRGACRRPALGGPATRPLRPACTGRDGRAWWDRLREVHFTASAAGAPRVAGSASRPSATWAAWTAAPAGAEGHVGPKFRLASARQQRTFLRTGQPHSGGRVNARRRRARIYACVAASASPWAANTFVDQRSRKMSSSCNTFPSLSLRPVLRNRTSAPPPALRLIVASWMLPPRSVKRHSRRTLADEHEVSITG